MSKLEKITPSALVLVVIVAIGVITAEHHHAARRAIGPHALLRTPDKEKLNLPPVDWAKSDKNVVLLLHSDCSFCSDSMPFYRELEQQRGRNRIRLYFVSQESLDMMYKYLAESSLASDGVFSAPHGFGGDVVHTPTLLLVSDRGVVLQMYTGFLNIVQQEDFRKTLDK